MIKNGKIRCLPLLLALVLVIGLFPLQTLAVGGVEADIEDNGAVTGYITDDETDTEVDEEDAGELKSTPAEETESAGPDNTEDYAEKPSEEMGPVETDPENEKADALESEIDAPFYIVHIAFSKLTRGIEIEQVPYTTLEDAVKNAQDGDIIVFNTNEDVILTSALTINKSLTFKTAAGVGDVKIYSASGKRHMTVSGGNIELTFDGVILDGGRTIEDVTAGKVSTYSGGISSIATNLAIVDAVIQNCYFEESMAIGGGGIYIKGGSASITGGRICGNTAGKSAGTDYGHGGGIYIHSGVVTISDVEISGNKAISGNGGGVYVSGGTVNIVNGTKINDNVTKGPRSSGVHDGAGIYINSGTITIKDTEINNNKANDETNDIYTKGGGIFVKSGTVSIANSTINENVAMIRGGGIYVNADADVTVTDSEISGNMLLANNASSGGGGIYLNKGTLTLENVAVTNNGALKAEQGLIGVYANAGEGGGIHANGGIFNVTGGAITGNKASAEGGGIYITSPCTAKITDVEISDNASDGYFGGGIYAYHSTVTIVGGEVRGNKVTGSGAYNAGGGGIYIQQGTAEITDVVVSGNEAYCTNQNSGGGGIYIRDASVAIKGGQVIGNTATLNHTSAAGGGGICIHNNTTTSNKYQVTIDGTEISGNKVVTPSQTGNGGGIYAYIPYNTMTVSDAVIDGNTAEKDGGGVYLASSGTFNMADSEITNNTAGNDGGGIYTLRLSTVYTNNVTFAENTAAKGYVWTVTENATSGDSKTHNSNIVNTTYTTPFTNAYSNYDINYIKSGVTYTVTYDANSGTGAVPVDNLAYVSGATVTVLGQSDLVKDGHAFTGWNTKSDGTGTAYAEGDTFTITANVILYAQWEKTPEYDFLEVIVTKVDEETYGTLEGAEFIVFCEYNGETYYFIEDEPDGNGDVHGGTWTKDPDDPYITVYTSNNYGEFTANIEPLCNLLSEELEDDSEVQYYFREIKAPNDYVLNEAPIEFDPYDFDVVAGRYCEVTISNTREPAQSIITYTVTYDANGGTGTMTDPNSPYAENSTVNILVNTFTRNNYVFTGWNTSADGTGAAYAASDAIIITCDLTFYAQWKYNGGGNPGGGGGGGSSTNIENEDVPLGMLETDDHLKYLNGYPDGSVRADHAITRAETASIFYRLLKKTYKDGNASSTFTDVAYDAWYSLAVSTLADLGIIMGYEDGTFRPDDPITRAEFATIASRFDKLTSVQDNIFSDVDENHWAVAYINTAYQNGWINGYEDGTFKPQQSITRAEVVKIVNTMLNRNPDHIEIENPYNDITEAHWAYIHVMEASIEHDYTRDDAGIEVWTTGAN